jgi:hypothetical protein
MQYFTCKILGSYLLLVEELEPENELEIRMRQLGESGDQRLGKGGERDEESRVSKVVAPI